jgi:hypothetical protein
MSTARVAPLRAIKHTERTTKQLELLPGQSFTVPVLNHTLECGHKAEPMIRAGCRLGPVPKRRRCKECLEGRSDGRAL